jgi:site-specific recombinase XerD
MEELFVRPWARVRMHEGPMGQYIDAFIHTLADAGYARDSMRRAAWLVGDFSRWLLRRRIAASEITQEGVDAFLRCRKRRKTPRCEDRLALSRLLKHLARDGVIVVSTAAQAMTPVQQLEVEYVAYMRRERNLAPTTIRSNRMEARRLLTSLFADGEAKFEHVGARDVIAHVRRVTSACCPTSARNVVGGVRAFLRFACCRGLVDVDLSKCIPTPAHWSLSSIPRAMDEDHVRRVLLQCDRTTVNGCRDYAIILLLARLGLRAGEMVALQVDDIDWRTGELQVRNGRTRVDRLPIPHDVGEALTEYLRKGRPPCASRHFFVRTQAPRQGFASGTAIAGVVRRALQRADLDPPSKGAHALRHALATRLLRQGASLAEIGEVLRHRRQRTTMIYAKVDLLSLRSLATHWPGCAQ